MGELQTQDNEPRAQTSLAQRILQRARYAVTHSPGSHYLAQQAQAVEDVVLNRIRERLQPNGYVSSGRHDMSLPAPAKRNASHSGQQGLHQRIDELMERSVNQTVDSATDDLFHHVIDQLVADEVRILTALSDYSKAPISHLEACGRLIGPRNRLIGYLNRIGNECGVMLADYTPYYLHHLVTLGLLSIGPEDREQVSKYEAMENGTDARETSEIITNEMKLQPRFVRQTVRLSEFGVKFWQHCSAK